ncbi:MAG TPA: transposase, partial [Balneolaceae bacterium]|nr:transposase [Balneolaceae bacterium]
PYFVTFSVINWIDVFIRPNYQEILLSSFRFCQNKKGLILYAWCIMPSHVHLIIGTKKQPMQNILRDFKSFTSRKLKEEIASYPKESRKEWMTWMMKRAGLKNGNNHNWQFWQQHNHPIELTSGNMIHQKLEYLHFNPVKAGFVKHPKHWKYSSADDYYGGKGILDIEIIY